MRRIRWASVLLFAALVFGALGVSRAPADDITTTTGKKITGKLVAVDAQNVTFSTGEARVQVPGKEIVVVDLGNKVVPLAKDATFSEIELTDNSVIRVARFTLKGKKFDLELMPGPTGLPAPVYEIPMNSVFTAMRRAEDPKTRDAWKALLPKRGKRDLYVQRQADGMTFLSGTILEGIEDKDKLWNITLQHADGTKEDLLQSRSAGFVFYQPQAASVPPTVCYVHDVYGNKLTATAIDIATDGVKVTTVAGATVKYPSLAAVAKLDYAQGNVAYLSDMESVVDAPKIPPEEKRLNPGVSLLRDRSLSNAAIKLDNFAHPKGLCIAPEVVVTYNLNGDYAQFKAVAGIDENGANATSSAKLTVEADGQVLFSETLARKDKAKQLVLAVKGVKQLRIIVEADSPFNGNYVLLGDAKVQK